MLAWARNSAGAAPTNAGTVRKVPEDRNMSQSVWGVSCNVCAVPTIPAFHSILRNGQAPPSPLRPSLLHSQRIMHTMNCPSRSKTRKLQLIIPHNLLPMLARDDNAIGTPSRDRKGPPSRECVASNPLEGTIRPSATLDAVDRMHMFLAWVVILLQGQAARSILVCIGRHRPFRWQHGAQ